MRRTLALAALSALLVSGCGSDGDRTTSLSSDFGSVIRASVAKAQADSSKLAMTIATSSKGQDVTVRATGAMGGFGDVRTLRGVIDLDGGAFTASERIVGGKLYLKIGSRPGWLALDLTKVAGTSFGDSANPANAAQVLLAAGKSTKKVGTDTVRGTETTHYKGTISLDQARVDELSGLAKTGLQKLLDSGVTTIPFEAWLDSEGRLRKMTQDTTVTVQGVSSHVRTLIELYDFGTEVDVTAPPANEVKDGSSLLTGLGGQG